MAQSNHSDHQESLYLAKFAPSSSLVTLVLAMVGLGILGTAVGIFMNPARGWAGYLTAFFFVTCLGVGGLFFATINHIAKAGWSVSIRRLSEAMTSFMPAILA
ncbi:MAG: molybdopterin oxidoreductase, partial [Bdellovibrio sp.]